MFCNILPQNNDVLILLVVCAMTMSTHRIPIPLPMNPWLWGCCTVRWTRLRVGCVQSPHPACFWFNRRRHSRFHMAATAASLCHHHAATLLIPETAVLKSSTITAPSVGPSFHAWEMNESGSKMPWAWRAWLWDLWEHWDPVVESPNVQNFSDF